MSTLLQGISNSVTTIPVSADVSLPVAAGVILIGTEQITYDNNYMGTLYGCVRGANSTSAASHLAGATVSLVGYYHALAGEAGSFTSVTVSGLTASTALTASSSFTLPVLTTTQRNALTATKGMLVYNVSTDALNYYDGAWQVVAKV